MSISAPQPVGDVGVSRRMAVLLSAVSFFHFAVLGSLLPILSLILRQTFGLSWLATGCVAAAVPLGLLPGLALHRRLAGCDSRLALAVSHMLAAGVVMGAHGYQQRDLVVIVQPWQIGLVVGLWSTLLAPASSWLIDLSRDSGAARLRCGTLARLWGAVGFLAPAWLSEAVFPQFPLFQTDLQSGGLPLLIAGWAGIMAALLAALVPGEEVVALPQFEADRPPVSLRGLTIAFVLLVLLVRARELWGAPFLASAVQEAGIRFPFAHRMSVAAQVFEVTALFALASLMTRLGVRLTLMLGVCSASAAFAIQGWVSQTPMSGQLLLMWLLMAQALTGVSTVMFFGTVGASLGLTGSMRCQSLVRIAGLTGAVTLPALGWLASAMQTPQAAADSALGRRLFEVFDHLPSAWSFGGWSMQLRGWPGLWWLASAACLLALPFCLWKPAVAKECESRSDSPA